MKRYRSIAGLLLLIVIIAGLVAGCSVDQPAADPKPQSGTTADGPSSDVVSAPLVGTSWALESMGEGEGQIAALEDQQPTLGFLADRYGGDSGCYFYVGVYTTSQSDVALETPARTGGICAEPLEVQEQESVYISSLATVTSYAIVDEKLEMYSSSDQLMLTMRPMDPASLQATVWSLQFLNVETQWQPLIPGTEITMQIDGNELSGSAGCNEYKASVSEKAGALTVSDLTATTETCNAPEGVMAQETLYLSMLEQAALLRQFPVSLQLLDIDGAALLLYGAQ